MSLPDSVKVRINEVIDDMKVILDKECLAKRGGRWKDLKILFDLKDMDVYYPCHMITGCGRGGYEECEVCRHNIKVLNDKLRELVGSPVCQVEIVRDKLTTALNDIQEMKETIEELMKRVDQLELRTD